MNIEIAIGEMPGEKTASSGKAVEAEKWLGMEVSRITPQLSARFKLPSNQTGVLIVNISPESPAASSGLMTGDVIIDINNIKVEDLEDYNKFVKVNKSLKSFLFHIARGGGKQYIAVNLEE
jgi:serine protease Do